MNKILDFFINLEWLIKNIILIIKGRKILHENNKSVYKEIKNEIIDWKNHTNSYQNMFSNRKDN